MDVEGCGRASVGLKSEWKKKREIIQRIKSKIEIKCAQLNDVLTLKIKLSTFLRPSPGTNYNSLSSRFLFSVRVQNTNRLGQGPLKTFFIYSDFVLYNFASLFSQY